MRRRYLVAILPAVLAAGFGGGAFTLLVQRHDINSQRSEISSLHTDVDSLRASENRRVSEAASLTTRLAAVSESLSRLTANETPAATPESVADVAGRQTSLAVQTAGLQRQVNLLILQVSCLVVDHNDRAMGTGSNLRTFC